MVEMEKFNFLTDDWKKIPLNYRFLILTGAFLIFNSWLLDHWDSCDTYLFWGTDIRALGYSLGLSLILLAFLLLVLKQLLFFKKLVFYRTKYPLRSLGVDYFLISFRGYVVLFDKKLKKYHHIAPFETAQDLLFVERWIYLGESFPPDPKYLLPTGCGELHHRFEMFSDGGPINTRN